MSVGYSEDPTPTPISSHLQFDAVVKLNGTGTALQRGEGNVSVTERRDVTVLTRTQGTGLVIAFFDHHGGVRIGQIVRLTASGTVMLVRHPVSVGRNPLVDGERLGTRGVEDDADVGDVVGLAQVQRQVDVIGLDALEHGLRLPPGGLVRIVEIGEGGSRMVVPSAHLATLLVRVARLLAHLDLILLTARVGRLHCGVVGGVLELGNTALREGRGRSVLESIKCGGKRLKYR